MNQIDQNLTKMRTLLNTK